ncbi:hypothetical protein E1287_04485 [Actinomadura sp. KC06]|uniref:hypothetical protein n=1 Tax=Actinomadura sp. KC06 TaxID=2530369 RepID=UPI0010500FCB|nr:hypothetical protein [Actinomadura sp. KC06]TDD39066.1 hypothetical protein E1287_04485 [Actinomadura sp. KC06]
MRGARITGRLDLDGTEFDTLLDCDDCVFEDTVSLAEANLRTLRITGSRLPAFKAARLRATGLVSLEGSSIDGRLRLDHARLESEVRLADVTTGHVQAHDIEVRGTLDATGITVDGEFNVRGGQITGNLVLTGGRFSNPDERAAVHADAVKVGGQLRAADVEVYGPLLLRNAQIGSSVGFHRARLSAPGRDALNAGGGAYQWLSYAFVAAGWVLATTIAAGTARVIGGRGA